MKIDLLKKKKKKSLKRENNFLHSFESKREKKIQSSMQSTNLVCFFFVLQIILYWEVDVHESQSTIDCVRSNICFKEIVSNTKLDLNHLSFVHLVCEFLIICRFLLIYTYTIFIYCFCLLYLFVLLLIFRFVCSSFCFITKVNC